MLSSGVEDGPSTGDPLAVASAFLASLNRPGPLVVAVSGGGDSMALLTALHAALQDQAGSTRQLIAATVDHALRPASADEARWVGAFCAARAIEHHVIRWQGEKPATGIQAAARAARYGLIADVARRVGAVAVVTAHTFDDQAETVAMRARRVRTGGPARGLAGMAPATLVQKTTWVLRPFLALSRGDLRRWLTGRDVHWIDDPSNEDARFERVRVRSDGGAIADAAAIAARQAARRSRAERLAAVISERAVVHGGPVLSFGLDPAVADGAIPDAVAVLMALVGGRPHLPGRAVVGALADFLGGNGPARMNAARVVAERHRGRLYLHRERRGLPVTALEPGVPGLYDGRYEIALVDGSPAATVAPPDAETVARAMEPLELAGVPSTIMRKALAAEPAVAFGEGARLASLAAQEEVGVGRHLALFDAFLPSFDITLANSCAVLFGRRSYPPPPLAECGP